MSRPSQSLIDRRLEEEIDYARRLIEAAGDRLSDDPILLMRHATTLQSFDYMAQMLGHIARVIGAEDRAEAIERVGMTEMRTRLMRPDSAITSGASCGLVRSGSNPFSQS